MSEQLEAQARDLKVRIFDLNEQVARLNNIIGQVAEALGCVVDGKFNIEDMIDAAHGSVPSSELEESRGD